MKVDWSAEADRLRSSIRQDPFYLRYIERMQKALVDRPKPLGSPPVTNPRDAAGEQRLMALMMLERGLPVGERDPNRHAPGPFQSTREAVDFDYDKYGVLVHSAIPYLWLNRIHSIAFSHNLPRHIVAPTFPHPVMWWSFEGSIPMTLDTAPGEEYGIIDAMLVVHEMGRMTIVLFGAERLNGRPWIIRESVPIGARYPEQVSAHCGLVLRMLAFVNSPYVQTGRRKSHEKGAKVKWHGRRIGDPVSLNVVALRSSVREAVEVERGEGPMWKQRWLVRGHYRAQWYPSLKAHRVIWIAPYLKGPEDAPLAAQHYAVVR